MTLTKDRIIQSMYKRLEIPKIQSAQLIDSFLEIMKRTLENGEEVNADFSSRGGFDLLLRHSFTNRFDVGGRFGFGEIGIDLKYQIVKNEKHPSISIGAGVGIASHFGGIYLSKKHSFNNFIIEPLVNIDYTEKRNQFWIRLPDKYRTYDDAEVAGSLCNDGSY